MIYILLTPRENEYDNPDASRGVNKHNEVSNNLQDFCGEGSTHRDVGYPQFHS